MSDFEATENTSKLSSNRRSKKLSNFSDDSMSPIKENNVSQSDVSPTKMRMRIVEDSDILPFLIKEPNCPTLVRRFIGSNAGLLCKFCNENKHQVIGRFSEDGILVITGEHLLTCKPFNLEENSTSVGCQTDDFEDTPKGTENFEICGNILKVNGREYIDTDGDGKMYYCKFCLRTKKIVVEAKVKTTVTEEEHCSECRESAKVENKENIENPPRLKEEPIPQSAKKTKIKPKKEPKNVSIVSESGITRIQLPRESYVFEYNGKKKYILLQNPSNSKEYWEFMEHTTRDGISNYRCLSCTSYYLKFNQHENELCCTPRAHQCITTPLELLKEKYQELRAGVKINHQWWSAIYEKYNIPALPRRLHGR